MYGNNTIGSVVVMGYPEEDENTADQAVNLSRMQRVKLFIEHLKEDRSLSSYRSPSETVFWVSSCGSVDGKPKTNQDFVAVRDGSVLCLSDGHGSQGEVISRLVAEWIVKEENTDEVGLAESAQTQLKEQVRERAFYSGCTGVWIRKVRLAGHNCLSISSVGDSRCLVISENWNIIFETRDHKPDDPIEYNRIHSFGGAVTFDIGDVPRVAGLALARAFGDFAASSSGVIGTPDVVNLPLEGCLAAVVASDGVFDVMTSREVVDFLRHQIVEEKNDITTSLTNLVKVCKRKWDEDSQNTYCDDITCALWLLNA